jgi:hypothetical protein
MLKITKFLLIIAVIAIALLNDSCKKNDNNSTAYVNFTIDITSIQYSELDHDGGYVYVTGGENGILIYRSINDFYIYDRTCTLRSDSCKQIVMDKSNLYAVDNGCKSKYIILDGSPDGTGPSKKPLMRYHYTFDGMLLHVYN